MNEQEIDNKVLEIVKAQGPDYLISPHATAFVVEGLEAGTVEDSLVRIWASNQTPELTHDTVTLVDVTFDEEGNEVETPVLDDKGKPVIVDQGWKFA